MAYNSVKGAKMSQVSVITGGAGGMGSATAKIVGQHHSVVLADVRKDRLRVLQPTLTDLGIVPTVVDCDVTDREAVIRLFETAAGPRYARFGDPHRGGESQHGRRRLRHAHQCARHT